MIGAHARKKSKKSVRKIPPRPCMLCFVRWMIYIQVPRCSDFSSCFVFLGINQLDSGRAILSSPLIARLLNAVRLGSGLDTTTDGRESVGGNSTSSSSTGGDSGSCSSSVSSSASGWGWDCGRASDEQRGLWTRTTRGPGRGIGRRCRSARGTEVWPVRTL